MTQTIAKRTPGPKAEVLGMAERSSWHVAMKASKTKSVFYDAVIYLLCQRDKGFTIHAIRYGPINGLDKSIRFSMVKGAHKRMLKHYILCRKSAGIVPKVSILTPGKSHRYRKILGHNLSGDLNCLLFLFLTSSDLNPFQLASRNSACI